MVERRSLTEGAGSIPANCHTRCEVVAQKKTFLRSCRHTVSSVLSKCATNAGGNYIVIRRSSGASPGMRNRISSGESAGHRFLAPLSSRSIFLT
jgi:hypothetical protein